MDTISMADEAIVKEPQVRSYELLCLVPNKYTEDEVPQIHKTVNELIAKAGGTVKKEINYGKRRLAYPVKHNHYGYYLLSQFDMASAGTKELNADLKVQDEVLRHLITIAIPEGALPEEAGDLRQVEQPKAEPEQQQTRKRPTIADAKATKEEKKKMAKGSVFDLEKELGVTAEEAKEALETEGKEKSKKDESVDMAGLESKLDEIMGDLDKKDSK